MRTFSFVCVFVCQICSLMRGGIAERGGVRVGHRIIEINGQSVVATAHEKIVQALSNSVGEVKIMHTQTHIQDNKTQMYVCVLVIFSITTIIFTYNSEKKSVYRFCI